MYKSGTKMNEAKKEESFFDYSNNELLYQIWFQYQEPLTNF